MASYGQGSLRQKANGKWFARYWGPDNKQHAKTFDRKGDAVAFLNDAQTDRRRGSWIDPSRSNQKFGPWAEEWMRGRHNLEPSSRSRDESHLRNHILPAFENRALGRIEPLEVRAWVNDLVTKLSPRTVRDCYRIFGAIMRAAVMAKIIGEAPVGRGVVDLPKVNRKPERFLAEDELEAFAQEFDPFFRPIVYAAAYTGCRSQELTGLQRPFLDLKERKLHVRRVTARDGGRAYMKDYPKSDAGRRSISLPLRLVEILTFHLARAPQGELDLVFPGRNGGIIGESNFRQRHWDPAVERFLAGLKQARRDQLTGFTFHDLRHTHVSWLIDAGVHEHKIVRRMGWTDASMLHRVYGHLFPNAEEDLVDDLDRRWSSASNGSLDEETRPRLVDDA